MKNKLKNQSFQQIKLDICKLVNLMFPFIAAVFSFSSHDEVNVREQLVNNFQSALCNVDTFEVDFRKIRR